MDWLYSLTPWANIDALQAEYATNDYMLSAAQFELNRRQAST